MNDQSERELNQICVQILRQFEQESAMLDRLDAISVSFGKLIEESTIGTPKPVDMSSVDGMLEQFKTLAAKTVGGRSKILKRLGAISANKELSIGEFVQQAPPAFKDQLRSERQKLRRRMLEIKSRLEADSKIVYHSFDFYRRFLNGIVDRITEEQNYNQQGQVGPQSSGHLFEKAV